MRRPVAAAIVTGALATTTVAGGTAAVATGILPMTGALQFADVGEAWGSCLPATRDALVGIPLDYRESGPIRLLSVNAVEADGIRLAGSFVTTVDPDLRGGFQSYPPTGADDDAHWRARTAVNGTSIRANEQRDLLLHVRRDGDAEGSIADFTITYRQGWRVFTVPTFTAFTFENDCSDEDDE